MTFVILTGGIDLSVGSILAASAMAALIASLIPGWGLLGIPAALLTGLFFGFLNGGADRLRRPAAVHRHPGLADGGARHGPADGRRHDGVQPGPAVRLHRQQQHSLGGVARGSPSSRSLVIIVSWFILRRTVLGVRIYAVGGNPAAARLSGIKVWAILLFVYCVSGFLAGLGGVMSAARLFAANGLQLGQSYELDAIAAVILGGTSFVGGIGSIWGTLIGALIIAVLSNGLDPARRLRHLAVHHQGPGDHRRGRARPLPAAGQRPHLSARPAARPPVRPSRPVSGRRRQLARRRQRPNAGQGDDV